MDCYRCFDHAACVIHTLNTHLAVTPPRPWDNGSCWVAEEPVLKPTIKISHFGLSSKSAMMHCDCLMCGSGGDVIVPDTMERGFKFATHMSYMKDDTSDRPVDVFFAGTRYVGGGII